MSQRFRVKTLPDGRAMLNLGCGTKMNWEWNNLDFSPYAYLAHHQTVACLLRRLGFLSQERYERFLRVDLEVMYWDLRNGIPFDNNTFDVVYSSHFLEHIDRDSVSLVLKECYRVLKPNGTIRVVVPDLQFLISRYVSSISALENGDESALSDHFQSIHDLFDQMVRQQITGTTQQRPLVRQIERFLRGDAAKAGELHRWMYDKYSLGVLLSRVGFKDVRAESPFASRIEGWSQFNLDTNEDGSVYKPESVYVEGIK